MQSRVIKIWSIVLCFIISYVMIYHIENEIYLERFPGIFIGFIDAVLNNHISLNYLSSAPLFYFNVSVDPSLPDKIRGVAITESYFPNNIFYFLILVYLLGISPQSIVILPLGVLFIPSAYLALIREYIPIKDNYDYLLHIFVGIYYIIFLSVTKFYGSFYVAPTALMLVLIIFFCIKKFVENDKTKHIYYLILCISLLSLAHTWHSMLMIVLTYIIALYATFIFIDIFRFIQYSEQNTLIKNEKYSLLVVTSIVITLTFTHLWQSNYLDVFLKDASIYEFLLKAFLKLKGGIPFEVPYAYNYKDLWWGQVYFKSYFFILIISSIMLAIAALLIFLNKSSNFLEHSSTYVLAILMAQIINAYSYYKSNSINFPIVTLFFPLLATSYITKIQTKNIKKLLIISLILMILLSIVCSVSLRFTNEAGETSLTKYENTESSFEWIFYKADKSKEIIVDFNIIGKYISREAKMSNQLSLKYKDLHPEHYEILVGDALNYLPETYVVIDQATMSKGLPVHVIAARALLKPELSRINRCSNQNKLYEDGHISIFMLKPP